MPAQVPDRSGSPRRKGVENADDWFGYGGYPVAECKTCGQSAIPVINGKLGEHGPWLNYWCSGSGQSAKKKG